METGELPIIRLEDEAYPLTLDDVRAAHPDKSLAKRPKVKLLEKLGFAYVNLVAKPTDRPTSEGHPIRENGEWKQRWVTKDSHESIRVPQIEDLRRQRIETLVNEKEKMLMRGFGFTQDTFSIKVPLDVDSREYLTELRINLMNDWDDGDTVLIPSVDDVFIEVGRDMAKTLLEKTNVFYLKIQQDFLRLKKRVIEEESVNELLSSNHNHLETLSS